MSQTAPPPATTATGAPAQSRLWDVLLSGPLSPEQRNQRNVLIDAIGVGITAGVGSFLNETALSG